MVKALVLILVIGVIVTLETTEEMTVVAVVMRQW